MIGAADHMLNALSAQNTLMSAPSAAAASRTAASVRQFSRSGVGGQFVLVVVGWLVDPLDRDTGVLLLELVDQSLEVVGELLVLQRPALELDGAGDLARGVVRGSAAPAGARGERERCDRDQGDDSCHSFHRDSSSNRSGRSRGAYSVSRTYYID